MVLSVISAFVISPTTTDSLRAPVQGLFAPISVPTRKLAANVMHSVNDQKPVDEGAKEGQTRSADELVQENQQLRMVIANLSGQLRYLQELNEDRQKVGIVRPLCTPVAVAGADTGARRSLTLQPAPAGELRPGMPVLYPGGLAGRIDRAGPGGAHVKLINDTMSRVEASIGRYSQNTQGQIEFIPIATPTKPMVVGTGGEMVSIKNLTERDVQDSEVSAGDWVVLNDPEWPPILKDYRIGRIVSVTPQRSAPGFSEILVQPLGNLMALREVMVMNKEGDVRVARNE